MSRIADIKLVEDTFGPEGRHEERAYSAQRVEVSGGERIHRGDTYGDQPWRVRWTGGSASAFRGVTKVSIVDSTTHAAIAEGELNSHYGAPSDFDGGVEFWVLREEAP